MSHTASARTTARRVSAVALGIVVAAIIGFLVRSAAGADGVSPAPAPIGRTGSLAAPAPDDLPPRDRRGTTAEVDGALPEGATVFDDRYPGIANLDPDLLRSLREAAAEAGGDGVEFSVNSGWRSKAYQNQLLQEAVATYGSAAAAARWVATPDTSPHVSGEAVDVGSAEATTWLSKHGAAYGLCQIYRNEPWHYELRPEATNLGCPRMYADPTHDPRME